MQLEQIRRALLTAVVVLAAAVNVTLAAQAAKVDVSGTWNFDVQTAAGAGTPTVILTQDGEKLTGHYSSSTLGEADLTGTVKGTNIAFGFTADVQGNALPVTYTGTIDSPTAMKGTLSITAVGDGTFTATKK